MQLAWCSHGASVNLRIRRVSAVVNNPSTLRGWLSAWLQLHILSQATWAGDGDAQLYAARAGLSRQVGPIPPRGRMRRHSLCPILKLCIERDHLLEGAAAALAYTFSLRVPSELLQQAQSCLFIRRARRISYGPIRRKGKSVLSTLVRFCTCRSSPLLCPHAWVDLLAEKVPVGLCFSFSAKQLMCTLQPLLLETGIPESALAFWTSHCFRRGSGVDVLEDRGLRAMLAHGEWAGPRSAAPYASSDEQRAVGIAAASRVVDASDDED